MYIFYVSINTLSFIILLRFQKTNLWYTGNALQINLNFQIIFKINQLSIR